MIKIINLATGNIVAAYDSRPVLIDNPKWDEQYRDRVRARYEVGLVEFEKRLEEAQRVYRRLNGHIDDANTANTTKMPGYALIDTGGGDVWALSVEATISS